MIGPGDLLLEREGSALRRLRREPLILRWSLRGRLDRDLLAALSTRSREEASGERWAVIVEIEGLEGLDPSLRRLLDDPAFRGARHPRCLHLVSAGYAVRLAIAAAAAPFRLFPEAPRIYAAADLPEAIAQALRELA